MVYSVSVNLFHRNWIRHICRVLCKSLEPLLISLYFAKNMGNACFDIHSCTETISGYASVNSRWIGWRARTIPLVLCQVLAGFFFPYLLRTWLSYTEHTSCCDIPRLWLILALWESPSWWKAVCTYQTIISFFIDSTKEIATDLSFFNRQVTTFTI